jgi:arylsulfatase A-like enzyme/Flp pilus assembly protein TadD
MPVARLPRSAACRLLAATAAVAVALSLPSCRFRTVRAPVILISVDTLRSDHLPAYGYRGVATPALDALRGDAVLFARAYSHVPLTLPSHATIFTGLAPPQNGVRDNYGFPLGGGMPTLAQWLGQAGYATGAAVSSSVLEKSTGIARGFLFYDDSVGTADKRDGDVAEAALTRWISQHRREPFFAFLHLYEPHAPCAPPEPYRSRFSNAYDGEIARADEIVGALLAKLKEWDIYDRALIVFLSDHGEGLGEHGEAEHGVFLYREAIQVPLLIKFPRRARAGERIEEVAGLTDVLPTVAGTLGLAPPPALPGRDWSRPTAPASSAAPASPDRRIYSETLYPRLRLGWSDLASLTDRSYQYIEAPRPELYDLREDPAERNNLAPRLDAEFRRRKLELASISRSPAVAETADPERARKLAALGYLTAGSPDSVAGAGALPDPKDRIGTLKLQTTIGRLFAQKNYPELIRACREFLAANPATIEISRMLADAQEKTGDREGAIATLRQGLKDSEATATPDRRAAARERLAYLLVQAGRTSEALALGDGADYTDSAALNALGAAEAESGRLPRARALFERALSLDPNDPLSNRNLGTVLLRLGEIAPARERLEQAVRLDPKSAPALASLGSARARSGDEPGAAAAWQKAVELDPSQYEALYNLAIAAGRRGDVAFARTALRRFVSEAPPRLFAHELQEARRILGSLPG